MATSIAITITIMALQFYFLYLVVAGNSSPGYDGIRRILHEPLFPIQWTPPPPPQSSDTFPETPTPPSSLPGNIQTPSQPSSNGSDSNKKIIIGVSVSLGVLILVYLFGFFLHRRRKRRAPPPDARKLIGGEDGERRIQQQTAPEFLYLGTMEPTTAGERRRVSESDASPYGKLGSERDHPSPELQPLPPLTGPAAVKRTASAAAAATASSDDDLFYTPNRSVASVTSESQSSLGSRLSLPKEAIALSVEHHNPRSRRTSPRMQFSNSNSSPTHIKHEIQKTNQIPPPPAPPPPPPPPPPKPEKASRAPLPPPAPDQLHRPEPSAGLPPSRRQLLRPLPAEATTRIDIPFPPFRPSNVSSSSSRPAVGEAEENMDGEVKPKLKPLHWDKVRASSDRATVWDQLKSSSFQLNEDMIETLFINNATNPPPKETGRRSVLPQFKQENRVLDPKKSQNIAILLRALNVTREEVTEALLDGNPEGLGAELLETLVKMAPTKEEELILRDYNGDVSKLGPAERFLKAVLDIPIAFKRVNAMLYRANFESEVRYLRKSFETLEAACEDLSSSRHFLKLLEAVLRTGNRMNVGTNRGEAKAFKLDTLLKLADVKGTDGKTTLLHFVVQEIIRSEGSSSDTASGDPPNKAKDEEFRRQGLKVLAGLSSELGNVKNAAGMDSDVLSSYVRKLEAGLEKIRSVLQLEKSCEQGLKFFDSMRGFLREAEGEIGRVKDEEKRAMARVREITEYFHGDTAKEEAHPLRIFMVVRDFLSELDNVCREVGRLHERMVMGSARSFRISSSASLPVLHRYEPRLERNFGENSLSS